MQRLNGELEKHLGKYSETSQASKKELERLVEDRERLSRDISATKTENERLREELSRLHRSLDSSSHGAKDEVSRLQKMIDSLHSDLSRLNAEREKLTETVAAKERQFDKMEKQLTKVILLITMQQDSSESHYFVPKHPVKSFKNLQKLTENPEISQNILKNPLRKSLEIPLLIHQNLWIHKSLQILRNPQNPLKTAKNPFKMNK